MYGTTNTAADTDFFEGGSRGVTSHDFGYGRAAGVPGHNLIQILGEVKNSPIHILPISKIVPIQILFSNFTHSYTVWVKKDTPLTYF